MTKIDTGIEFGLKIAENFSFVLGTNVKECDHIWIGHCMMNSLTTNDWWMSGAIYLSMNFYYSKEHDIYLRK